MNKDNLDYFFFVQNRYNTCKMLDKIAFSLFLISMIGVAISGIFQVGNIYLVAFFVSAMLFMLSIPLIDNYKSKFKKKHGFFKIFIHNNNKVAVKCFNCFKEHIETRYFKDGVLHNEDGKAIKATDLNIDPIEGYFYKGKEVKVNSFEEFKNFIKINNIASNF